MFEFLSKGFSPMSMAMSLLTPERATEASAAIMQKVNEIQHRDNCLYELRALMTGAENFRIDVFRRAEKGAPPQHVRSYTKENIGELLNLVKEHAE